MATKAILDARKMMELAVEVMKKSLNEPRPDGDVAPKVGAVLWKSDGLTHFVELGLLRRIGRGPATEYLKQ